MTTTHIDQFHWPILKSTNWGKSPSKICMVRQRARLHELNSNELACANAGHAWHVKMQIKHWNKWQNYAPKSRLNCLQPAVIECRTQASTILCVVGMPSAKTWKYSKSELLTMKCQKATISFWLQNGRRFCFLCRPDDSTDTIVINLIEHPLTMDKLTEKLKRWTQA